MQLTKAKSLRAGGAVLLAALVGGCGEQVSPEEHLARGESALARGEWRTAVIEFKNVLLSEPANANARALLGQATVRLGNPAAAEQDLERARQSGVDESLVQPWLAESWLGQGKYDQVNALVVADETPAARRAALLAIKSQARLARGEIAEAGQEAESALQADPESVSALLAMARVKAGQGALDDAGTVVRQALSHDEKNAVAHNLLGEIERAAGRLTEAEAAFTQAMQDPVQAPESQLNRAYVRIQAENLDGAQQDIDELKKRIKGNLLVDYAEAMLLYARQDYRTAIERLDAALGTNPNYIPAVRLAGMTRLALEEPARARVHLERTVSATPDDTQARRMLIMALLQTGAAAEAERLARVQLERTPQDTAVMDLLASALMMQGKSDESVGYLRQVNAVLPDSALASARLGAALLGQGDAQEGLRILEEALKRDPALQTAAEQLVFGYVSSGNLDQALTAALAYRDREPGSVRAQALLGAVYLQRQQTAEASQAFLQALELEPGNLPATTGLATLALQNNDLAAARGHFAKSLEHHPEDDRLRILLARLAMAQNDTAGAKAYLDEAVKRNPDALLPRLYLAAYYQKIGEPAQSLQLLAEARRDSPTNPMLLALVADAQLALQQFGEAKTTLQALVTQAPNDPQVQVALASAYAGLGETAPAREALKKALELDGDLIPAINLLARLAIAEKDTAGAEQGLQELKRRLGDTHADVLLIEGQLAQLKGDLSAANDAFQQLLTSGDSTVDFDADPTLRSAAEQMILGYVRNGDPDGALKAALELRDRQPDSARAHNLLGVLYLRGQQQELAAQAFQRALELEPANIAASNGLAAVAIQEKDFDRAQRLYEESLKQHPNDVALLVGLARLELLKNDPAAAEGYLSRAVQENPLVLQPRLFLAAFLLRQGHHERAIDVIAEAMVQHPDDSNLLGLQAEAELALKRYEAARRTLNKLDRLQPKQPRVLIALAGAEAGLGRLDEAKQALERAVATDAQSVAALNGLARLAIARKSFEEATARIEDLQQILGADNQDVLFLKASLAESQGDMAAALASYQRLFEQAPGIQSVVLLARGRLKSNDMEGAERQLADWLETHPDDTPVRFELAQLQMNTKRPDEAIPQYQRVLEKVPDNVIALNNLAWLLQEREPAKALEYAKRAHTLAPQSADIADTLAVILARKGDLPEARRVIDAALAIDGENGSILFHKAQILQQSGERRLAEQTLESALKVGGAFAERAEAEAMLKMLRGG